LIGERTKAALALAAAQAKGTSFGGTLETRREALDRAEALRSTFKRFASLSANARARELNRLGEVTPNGKTVTVERMRKRLEAKPMSPSAFESEFQRPGLCVPPPPSDIGEGPRANLITESC
jgi:hypothetical protein